MKNNKIGLFIKNLREKNNMTQEQLANLLYVSRQSISKWETGITLPTIDNFNALAKIFGVTVDELLLGEEKKEFYNQVKFNIIQENFLIKKRNLKLILAIITITILFIFLFLLYYFFNNYNKFQIYYLSTSNDVLSITDGLLVRTNEKTYFYLGNVKVNNNKEINSIKIYYKIDNQEQLVYISEDTTNTMIIENVGYNEYFIGDINNIINNLYVDIDIENNLYTLKIDTRLDYTNNKFLLKKKAEYSSQNTTPAINDENNQLYQSIIKIMKNDLLKVNIKNYTYDLTFVDEKKELIIYKCQNDNCFYGVIYHLDNNEVYQLIDGELLNCNITNDNCHEDWQETLKSVTNYLINEARTL